MATVRSALDIMGEFYSRNRANEQWRDWFIANDIAIPLAWLVWSGIATPTDEAVPYVNETWESFCAVFEVDPYNEFDTIDDLLDFIDSVDQ